MKKLSIKARQSLFIASTSLIALTQANAQNAPSFDNTNSDDEIIVEGQRFLSIDKLNAVKTPTPIINVPQSLSIIGKEQIQDQAFTSISDITRYTPGLTISQGEGHRDAIIIRGQQTTADFFQDGIRDDVQYFRPLYNIEQVEVLRGSNALLFGRGGTGGIVNRVTKKATAGIDFTNATASVDSFGAFLGSVDKNFDISDTVGFRLNGFYEDFNNHRDFFGGRRFGFNPTTLFQLSPDTSITLSYEYLNDDRVVDRGVTSQNVEGGPDVPLEGFDNTFFGSPDENFATLEANIIRTRIDHKFSENIIGNITAQYADYNKVYSNLFASEEVEVVNGTFDQIELDGYRDTTNRENFFIQGNVVSTFDTGFFSHLVLIGGEYSVQDTRNARLDNVFDVNGDGIFDGNEVAGSPDDDQLLFDFTDPLNIPSFAFVDLNRNRDTTVRVFSAYLQDQIDITQNLKLVAGIRFDSFDIDVLDIFEVDQGNDGEFSRLDEEFSPRFGLIYKPAENISFYASFSRSFLPRSGEQFLTLNLTNSQTEPQSFENIEAGLKWDIKPDLSFTAAVFELDRDSFLTVETEDVGQLTAVEGSVTRGFELQFFGNLTDWWSVNTGYSYLDGEVEFEGSTLDGNRTRQTPTNSFSLWNNFQITPKFSIGGGLTHQSSFFVREDNLVEVPGYTRFDAAAYYDVNDGLRLQLNIENLFDTDYFPDAHSNDNITTGKPLNARFSISKNF